VKKRFVASVLVLLLAVAVGLLVGCGGDLPKDAVAKVGENYITQEQFDQRMADFEAQYAGQGLPDKDTDPEGYKDFQLRVLDYMVMYEMALQKAPSLNVALPDVTVTDAEVQTEIDTILNDYFGGDQAQFDAALAAQNMTLDQLKERSKASMRYTKEDTFLNSVYDEVTKDVTTVPDEEIAAYYEENKAKYVDDETRTARHILISATPDVSDDASTTSTDGSTSTTAGSSSTSTESTTTSTSAPTQADWDEAKATAEKVRADLVGGADWTKEAADYSDDTGTKDAGGDLGLVAKGAMVKEFEDSVFSLALNEISDPVKTVFGYHVIQVTGITEAKQYTLEEKKEEITTTLLNAKKGDVFEQWLIDTKAELGVIYKEGMAPTTTTTASTTATTSGSGDTTTTTAASSTATSAGQTITTAAPSTTTTAKP